jgi:hypothetical protein
MSHFPFSNVKVWPPTVTVAVALPENWGLTEVGSAACVGVASAGCAGVCAAAVTVDPAGVSVASSSPSPPQAAKATKSSGRTAIVKSVHVRDIQYLLPDHLGESGEG